MLIKQPYWLPPIWAAVLFYSVSFSSLLFCIELSASHPPPPHTHRPLSNYYDRRTPQMSSPCLLAYSENLWRNKVRCNQYILNILPQFYLQRFLVLQLREEKKKKKISLTQMTHQSLVLCPAEGVFKRLYLYSPSCFRAHLTFLKPRSL